MPYGLPGRSFGSQRKAQVHLQRSHANVLPFQRSQAARSEAAVHDPGFS